MAPVLGKTNPPVGSEPHSVLFPGIAESVGKEAPTISNDLRGARDFRFQTIRIFGFFSDGRFETADGGSREHGENLWQQHWIS